MGGDAPLCIHCGMPISAACDGVHLEGSQAGLQRCGSESGLPYGYNAHAEAPCEAPCLGATFGDGEQG